MPTMTVSGHRYELDRDGVQAALEGVLPEPIHEHFVVINGRRWPPKQVLALVTGLDRADFTTHRQCCSADPMFLANVRWRGLSRMASGAVAAG